jgi:hypothetical protein
VVCRAPERGGAGGRHALAAVAAHHEPGEVYEADGVKIYFSCAQFHWRLNAEAGADGKPRFFIKR